jgi:hypothetical protein
MDSNIKNKNMIQLTETSFIPKVIEGFEMEIDCDNPLFKGIYKFGINPINKVKLWCGKNYNFVEGEEMGWNWKLSPSINSGTWIANEVPLPTITDGTIVLIDLGDSYITNYIIFEVHNGKWCYCNQSDDWEDSEQWIPYMKKWMWISK